MKKNYFVFLLISLFFVSCENPELVNITCLYKINFETNGGSAIKSYRTDCVETLPLTYKTDFVLEGWYEKADFSSTQIKFPYKISRNTVLYAKWNDVSFVKYKVEHYKQSTDLDKYELSDFEEFTGKRGSKTQAVSKTYDGFSVKDFIQEEINSDGSTVIKIYYDRNKYKVNFNSNGGTGTMTSQNFMYGIQQNLKANAFTKSGYYFDGWAFSPDGNVYKKDMETVLLLENVTLYAKWIYGKSVSSENINTLKLENLESSCVVKITGIIDDSILSKIKDKILQANQKIILDLSETTGLTSIKSYEFKESSHNIGTENYTKLKSLILPDSIISIGEYAFVSCKSLESILIPASVKSIGYKAFYDSGLKTLELNETKTIAFSAFCNCKKLESLKISNVQNIGEDAFKDCTSLSTVKLLGVGTVGPWAFANCTQINNLELQNIEIIGTNAFINCKNLISVYIDAEILEMGAFEDCINLLSVTMGKRVRRIENFDSCSVFESDDELQTVKFECKDNWYYLSGGREYIKKVDNARDNAVYLMYAEEDWYRKDS